MELGNFYFSLGRKSLTIAVRESLNKHYRKTCFSLACLYRTRAITIKGCLEHQQQVQFDLDADQPNSDFILPIKNSKINVSQTLVNGILILQFLFPPCLQAELNPQCPPIGLPRKRNRKRHRHCLDNKGLQRKLFQESFPTEEKLNRKDRCRIKNRWKEVICLTISLRCWGSAVCGEKNESIAALLFNRKLSLFPCKLSLEMSMLTQQPLYLVNYCTRIMFGS